MRRHCAGATRNFCGVPGFLGLCGPRANVFERFKAELGRRSAWRGAKTRRSVGSDQNGVIPPLEVAEAAIKGLVLAHRFHRGGKAVALRRGRQLAERRRVSWRDLSAISDFFERHAVDRQGAPIGWGDDENPSAAYVSWLLWGGEAGKAWVTRIMERAERTMRGERGKAA